MNFTPSHKTMKERLIMNSLHLQKTFTQEYKEFFFTNDLIVSSPHVINRWDISSLEGIKTRIAQKIPTKMYVGINMRNDETIHLKTITRFLNKEQKFEEKDIETELSRESNEKMKQYIKEKLLEYGYTQGLDMTVLSENERGTGVASYSVRALLISCIIHIVWGNILQEELDDYTAFTKSKKFKEIYTTAKDIISTIWDIPKQEINTTALFVASIDNGNIWIGLESKIYLKEMYPKLLQIENNICLEHLHKTTQNPVEYSIINFGWFFHEFYNRETYIHEEKWYDSILKEYKMYQKKTTADVDMMNILYLQAFKSVKEAIINPNDDIRTNDFFANINRIGVYQTFIEKHMDLYRDIIASFKKNRSFKDEKIGLIPISSAKPWGTFLCITKSEKSRETLKKTIDELHDIWHTTVNFQYLSWEDGISEEHLKIEQYISKEKFSSYIQKGNMFLECWWVDNLWKKTIWNHRELLEKAGNTIVFDTIDGKIYLNNEISNHKEIRTQSGTVEVIKVLFENMGTYVNNAQLPASSYSKNKNEMVGKIILPLQELLQKRFNEKLDIDCTGTIVNFDCKLTPSKTNLYLLKKIM